MILVENELTELIAEFLHNEVWMEWSQNVAPEVSDERRRRWVRYWRLYGELDEAAKDKDRYYARKLAKRLLNELFEG